MPDVLGIDIGGANLKAAHSSGVAKLVPFEVWNKSGQLASKLKLLIGEMPASERVTVTMTAELCDCFETKRAGVAAVLDAVRAAANPRPVTVWSTAGQFVDVDTANKEYITVASANWHALATFACRFAPGPALLFDMGSTTTDIIPIFGGKPAPKGLTDFDRRQTSELVYLGVRRTPVCALLGPTVLAEVFATSLDAYLITGDIAEDPANVATADQRPATRAAAHGRLARMLGSDGELCSKEETQKLAARIVAKQEELLYSSMRRVASTLPALPTTIIIAGSGEFLAARVGKKAFATATFVSLSEKLGPVTSHAGCAHAVAVLGQEMSA